MFSDLCVYTNFFLILMQKIRFCIVRTPYTLHPGARVTLPVSYTHLDVYKRQGLGYGIPLSKTGVRVPPSENFEKYFSRTANKIILKCTNASHVHSQVGIHCFFQIFNTTLNSSTVSRYLGVQWHSGIYENNNQNCTHLCIPCLLYTSRCV